MRNFSIITILMLSISVISLSGVAQADERKDSKREQNGFAQDSSNTNEEAFTLIESTLECGGVSYKVNTNSPGGSCDSSDHLGGRLYCEDSNADLSPRAAASCNHGCGVERSGGTCCCTDTNLDDNYDPCGGERRCNLID